MIQKQQPCQPGPATRPSSHTAAGASSQPAVALQADERLCGPHVANTFELPQPPVPRTQEDSPKPGRLGLRASRFPQENSKDLCPLQNRCSGTSRQKTMEPVTRPQEQSREGPPRPSEQHRTPSEPRGLQETPGRAEQTQVGWEALDCRGPEASLVPAGPGGKQCPCQPRPSPWPGPTRSPPASQAGHPVLASLRWRGQYP